MSGVKSIYSAKLNSLLYKELDRDEMNAIGRLYMQLSYLWLNNFLFKKSQWSTVHFLTKIERFPYKPVDNEWNR